MSTKNQTNSISVLKPPFLNQSSRTPSARKKVSNSSIFTLLELKVTNVNDNSIIELIKKNILKLSLGNINNYLPTSLKINNEELIIIKEYINSINQNGNNNSKDKNLLKFIKKNARIIISIFDDCKFSAKTLSLKIHSCHWILLHSK